MVQPTMCSTVSPLHCSLILCLCACVVSTFFLIWWRNLKLIQPMKPFLWVLLNSKLPMCDCVSELYICADIDCVSYWVHHQFANSAIQVWETLKSCSFFVIVFINLLLLSDLKDLVLVKLDWMFRVVWLSFTLTCISFSYWVKGIQYDDFVCLFVS